MKPLHLLICVTVALAACGAPHTETEPHDEHHSEHSADEIQPEKGPHGGRLLSDGDFTVELAIFEQGVPPEYRAWVTQAGKPLALEAVKLTVTLTRFAGVEQVIAFKPNAAYLQSTSEVIEPHSFAVRVRAEHAGKSHEWTFESLEGRTRIAADMATQAGIVTAVAGPGEISEQLKLYGAIAADNSRVREVTARFPGVVRRMARQVGERVSKGEVLATVESNDSLQTYPITAPISGVVTMRHGAVGEATDATPLYTVADFSSVWAELQIFPKDRARLKLGQPVTVRAEDGREAAATLNFISAQGQAGSTALMVRAVIDNTDARWTPGEFVTANVAVQQTTLPLVVPLAALQTYRDGDAVFAVDGESYQALPVELGQRDTQQVEVRSGLAAGTRIVIANSYLVKADIEKSGASHDH